MKPSVSRSLPFTVGAAAAALQAGSLNASAASHAQAKARTFKGATIQTMHGPVQVSIVVKKKTIKDVKASIAPNEDGRSPFLQQNAVTVLREEVLTAQSAKIDEVSGATETSGAYIMSLQSAIKKAKKAKAL